MVNNNIVIKYNNMIIITCVRVENDNLLRNVTTRKIHFIKKQIFDVSYTVWVHQLKKMFLRLM